MINIFHNGKIIGIVEGRWFITKRKPEHFMKVYQGFGISKSVLNELKGHGVTDVRIIYEGKTGMRVFECQLSAFMNSDLIHVFEGSDKQKFVPVRCMVDKYGSLNVK